MTAAHLEIYQYDPMYGGAAIWAVNFGNEANGGVYSEDLGTIILPYGGNLEENSSGEYEVAKLNGFAFTHGGEAPKPGRVSLYMFGNTNVTTTTGVPVQGFVGGVSSIDTGYYSSGWVYPGEYSCLLVDHEANKSKWFVADIRRPFERIDFTLETVTWDR